MKLSIYESPKDDDVQLKLEKMEEGVKIIVVNSKGWWKKNLLAISNDGMIHLYSGIGDEYGFQLDREGRIKIHNDGSIY